MKIHYSLILLLAFIALAQNHQSRRHKHKHQLKSSVHRRLKKMIANFSKSFNDFIDGLIEKGKIKIRPATNGFTIKQKFITKNDLKSYDVQIELKQKQNQYKPAAKSNCVFFPISEQPIMVNYGTSEDNLRAILKNSDCQALFTAQIDINPTTTECTSLPMKGYFSSEVDYRCKNQNNEKIVAVNSKSILKNMGLEASIARLTFAYTVRYDMASQTCLVFKVSPNASKTDNEVQALMKTLGQVSDYTLDSMILSYKMPNKFIKDVKGDNEEDKFYFGYQYCAQAIIQKAQAKTSPYTSIEKGNFQSFGLEGALLAKFVVPEQRIECVKGTKKAQFTEINKLTPQIQDDSMKALQEKFLAMKVNVCQGSMGITTTPKEEETVIPKKEDTPKPNAKPQEDQEDCNDFE